MPMACLHADQPLWRLGVMLMALAVLFCALEASAANDRYYPVAPLKIIDGGGEAGVEFDYLREEQRREFANVEYVNRSIEEYILYGVHGYVYHPLLLDFQTRIRLGLLQQELERNGDFRSYQDSGGGSFNSYVSEYDLYVQILKEHPLSFNVSASRSRDVVRQLFTDRYLIESSSFGAGAVWKPGPFPMTLSVRDSEFTTYGTDSLTESHLQVLEYRVRNSIHDRIRSELTYRHQEYDQRFEAQLPFYDVDRETTAISDDLSFSNTIDFTRNGRNSLHSLVRSFSQTGTTEFENFYWQERLNLQHRPNLRTYYQYSVLESQLERDDIETRRMEIGLEHRLYESLLSHFDYHTRQTDFSDSAQDESGFTARFDYRKHTPAGLLMLGYARTVDDISRTGVSRLRTIIDEPLTFTGAIIDFLSMPNVIPGTIVVTDPGGLNPLIEGFDYEVETRGNLTGLRRIIGGRIDPGDTVLVDYRVEATPDIDYQTDSQAFNARFDFERYVPNLSVYYRMHNQDASGSAAEDDLSLLIYDSWLAGFVYDWRQISWIEEYEQYDSAFTSWNQMRHELQGRHPVSPALRWGWRLGLLNVDYDNDRADADSHDVLFSAVNVRGTRPGWGFWEIEAEARKESGLVDETLFGILGHTEFQWRRLRIDLGGRLEQRDRFDAERNRMHVFFQVAREF